MNQTEPSKQELRLLLDVQRHRQMRGYPPTGQIFGFRTRAETAQRMKTMAASAQELRRLLEKEIKESLKTK